MDKSEEEEMRQLNWLQCPVTFDQDYGQGGYFTDGKGNLFLVIKSKKGGSMKKPVKKGKKSKK